MKTVLICDDSRMMRKYLRSILERNGYQVIGEASNGKIAVEKYEELIPDIVTMDITMAEMNGIEAVKKIKETHNDAKIIMCSAMGQRVMIMDAVKNGATDFIIKPFQEAQVLESLKKAIG